MIEVVTDTKRAVPSRRALTLEAENAHLRRVLAEERRIDVERAEALKSRACEPTIVLNRALGRSEPTDARIVGAIADCIQVLDLDGRLISMNESGLKFFGAANFADLAGKPWADFWSSSDSAEAVLAAVAEARAGRNSRFQATFDDGTSGSTRWWDVVVSPMIGADGRPEQILAVARDITELKQDEARQSILMQEMAHRMKNMLAMVQAVATQTLRNAVSLDAASEAITARLLALSHAHDVLMRGSWSSACLRSIIDTAIALHGDGEPGRFLVEGPDVMLGPKPGMTLALILHELGTNAAKYGALSSAAGHIEISWRIESVGASERLFFRWEEIGGPAVKPPKRVGFGSRLIERSLVHSFGGNARLEFPESGVVLTMEAPLDMVVPAAKPAIG